MFILTLIDYMPQCEYEDLCLDHYLFNDLDRAISAAFAVFPFGKIGRWTPESMTESIKKDIDTGDTFRCSVFQIEECLESV